MHFHTQPIAAAIAAQRLLTVLLGAAQILLTTHWVESVAFLFMIILRTCVAVAAAVIIFTQFQFFRKMLVFGTVMHNGIQLTQ